MPIKFDNPVVVFSIALSLVFFAGCELDKDDKFQCPLLSDNISWNSYGRFIFEDSGRDSTARKIISECNWHVHNNHNGGTGGTLQVASPQESVIMVWAFNDFHAFRVSSGWTGSTEQGIKIGSDIFDLYRLYPGFTTDDGFIHMLDDGGNTRVRVVTNLDNTIAEITVGFYFRNL